MAAAPAAEAEVPATVAAAAVASISAVEKFSEPTVIVGIDPKKVSIPCAVWWCV
jgi:hypothetical protein